MLTIRVNDAIHRLDVDPDTPLLWVLREQLELTGVKYSCGIEECGACTVHVKRWFQNDLSFTKSS